MYLIATLFEYNKYKINYSKYKFIDIFKHFYNLDKRFRQDYNYYKDYDIYDEFSNLSTHSVYYKTRKLDFPVYFIHKSKLLLNKTDAWMMVGDNSYIEGDDNCRRFVKHLGILELSNGYKYLNTLVFQVKTKNIKELKLRIDIVPNYFDTIIRHN